MGKITVEIKKNTFGKIDHPKLVVKDQVPEI